MNHTESSIKIYFSKDYAQFSMINGNRQLNDAKIKRIQRDICDGLDVLRYCPIMVKENKKTERLEIIDGQHRFYVARKMGSKVWYVLVEELNLEAIARINSNTEKWKNDDYVNCYAQQENKSYLILQRFRDEHKLPFAVCLRLLSTGKLKGTQAKSANDNSIHDFKAGRFVVTHEKEAEAFVSTIKMFSAFPHWNSTAFIQAISIVIAAEKSDIVQLVEKWKKVPEALVKCDSAKAYLVVLEDIYNRYERTRTVLY